MERDQLTEFLLDVQANLEKTLFSVTKQLNDLNGTYEDEGKSHCESGMLGPRAADTVRVVMHNQKTEQQKTKQDIHVAGQTAARDIEVIDVSGQPSRLPPRPPGQLEDSSPDVGVAEMPGGYADSTLETRAESDKLQTEAEAYLPVVTQSSDRSSCFERDGSAGVKSGGLPSFSVKEASLFDSLLVCSWEEHTRKTISDQLEEVRQSIDIPIRQWSRHVNVEDAFGNTVQVSDPLHEANFPMTVTWKWLTTDQLAKHSWIARLKFLWRGLLDNTQLKAVLLRLKSRLKVLECKAASLVDEMVDDEQELAESVCNQDLNKFRVNAAKSSNMSGIAVDTLMAKDALRSLEALLVHSFTDNKGTSVRADELFQMAGVPFDDFVKIYVRDRNIALTCDIRHRREVVKIVARGIDMVDCLCLYLQCRIDANDQLLFKLFLLVVNVVTMVSTFIYEDMIKMKPIWQKQIQKIFDIVST